MNASVMSTNKEHGIEILEERIVVREGEIAVLRFYSLWSAQKLLFSEYAATAAADAGNGSLTRGAGSIPATRTLNS